MFKTKIAAHFCTVSCPKTNGQTCSGSGTCLSLLDAGLLASPKVAYNTRWDHDMILGCRCLQGFYGFDCSQRACPASVDPEVVAAGSATRESQKFTCQCAGACTGTTAIISNGQYSRTIFPNTVIRKVFENPDSQIAGSMVGHSLESIIADFLDVSVHSFAITYSSSPGPMPETFCQGGGTTEITVTFAYNAGNLDLLQLAPGLMDGSNAAVTSVTAVSDGSPKLPCSGRGVCDAQGGCTCAVGYSFSNGDSLAGEIPDCGFRSPGGQCPKNTAGVECSGRGTCSGSPAFTCTCQEGFQGADCSERVCPSDTAWWQVPTSASFVRSAIECSGRGLCNRQTGICQCQHGYEGNACERKSCVVSNFKPCGGLGRCVPVAAMIEAGTVQGKRPGSKSVQRLFCKLDGTSTSTDHFTLLFGFQETPTIKGSDSAVSLRRAIQRLHTAGRVEVVLNSGSGTTVCDATTAVEIEITFLDAVGAVPTLQAVDIVSGGGAGNGLSATSTGFSTATVTATLVSAGSLVKYGSASTAALRADMWDAHMLQGCLCDGYSSSGLYSDEGDLGKYKGPECQQQNCPTGADPHQLLASTGCRSYNTLLHAENATLTCAATAGSFTLEFRGQVTAPIAFSSTAAELETALEKLSTIKDVKVFNSAATICTAGPTATLIVFADPPGNVPSLVADTHRLTSSSFTISHTDAPGVLQECAGRGVCNENAGVCKCHTGYASSDGFGGKGSRGDCGHQLDASELKKVDQSMWQDTWRTPV